MKFTKMHGNGNDFIILNNMDGHIPEKLLPDLARAMCPRRTSIGADGLMAVSPAKGGGDFAMCYFNSDGSIGEMCGNGARCICRYGYDNGLAGPRARIETTAGLVTGERLGPQEYRVRINTPSRMELHRELDGLACAYVELGNPGLPHLVLLMEGMRPASPARLLPRARTLRAHPALEKGANVNFVWQLDRRTLWVQTYERGVEDFTLSCGTGVCSSVAALTLLGKLPGRGICVRTAGGTFIVDAEVEDGAVTGLYLTGPARLVFTGEFYPDGQIDF